MQLAKDAEVKIDAFKLLLKNTPENITNVKPEASAWSLKEILGHLVDSASNNHQRFVRLQEGDLYKYPSYHQEFWAQAQQVNTFDWTVLSDLWYSYNLLLLHIIKHIPEDSLQNSWQYEEKTVTLQWLVQDYFRHLFHHMQQFEDRKTIIEQP
jgi:hypothetical protein